MRPKAEMKNEKMTQFGIFFRQGFPQIYLQMQDEKSFQIRVNLMECVLCSLPGTMT